MGLKLYNTLTRTKEAFEPIDPSNVRMYVCGPTVYQRIHIGNARALIVFDVLFRLLRHLYGENHVTYARNITDIDDKIINEAKTYHEKIEELTARTTARFLADADELGCLQPTHQPKATEHIPEMQAMIVRLIEQGHAYAADEHVLFNVPSMPTYGRLSGRNREDQIAGARVEVAPYKRDPADFVLWKPSTPEQPGWDSPWGRGRPGWHIECSAMSERWLGAPFDIHGGGLDLIFPHHENEIAQSCCAHGIERMANYWMHNGFVQNRGEKMSKSLGNSLRLDFAFKRTETPEEWRFWLLSTHYRQPIDFTPDALHKAGLDLHRFYNVGARVLDREIATEPDIGVVEALADDLNTPAAIARLEALRREINISSDLDAPLLNARFLASCRLMGLLTSDERLSAAQRRTADMLEVVDAALAKRGHVQDEMEIVDNINRRTQLRQERRWKEADEIRTALEKKNIILEDTPDGTKWHRR